MNDLSTAIELLAVGMITVFIILTLVFLLGRFIIFIVNRYLPDEEVFKPIKKSVASISSIPKKHIAAITAVVNKVTQGKGQPSQIEKFKK